LGSPNQNSKPILNSTHRHYNIGLSFFSKDIFGKSGIDIFWVKNLTCLGAIPHCQPPTLCHRAPSLGRSLFLAQFAGKGGYRIEHKFATGLNFQENSWLFKVILVRLLMSYGENHVC
jgi:hypothetical protein